MQKRFENNYIDVFLHEEHDSDNVFDIRESFPKIQNSRINTVNFPVFFLWPLL